jgi:hypothetical protein
MESTELRLLEKIRQLPPEQLATVETFIDALHSSSDRALTLAVSQLSQPALQRIWDNADDAEYDQL